MNFRIADTFSNSLTKLTGDEQKAVKTTAFDLQMNPANPGMQFHRIERAKDKNFWSVRVGRDIRLIVHKTDSSLLLCYVDHHDKAYKWAVKRKLERHPKTGAAQLVEIKETVREVEVPTYKEQLPSVNDEVKLPLLFADCADDELLSYGVPEDWLADAKAVTEETLFELVERLPQEAGEALIELATGGTPAKPVVVEEESDPFTHPDAQRRFRLMTDSEELARALESPWEKWSVFLHPDQQEMVSREFNGSARVAGSAGTGKTVVALHRAAHLARFDAASNVLLTTFSITLANQLRKKLACLVGNEPEISKRIKVRAIDEVGLDVYEDAFGKAKVVTDKMMRSILSQVRGEVEDCKFSQRYIEREWSDVVDAWQLTTWEDYRDVARLGRKTRLGEKQRAELWEVFSKARQELEERGLVTMPMVFKAATEAVAEQSSQVADYAVVDEAQDVSVPQLRFLAALAGDKTNGLFFAGDLGQRIFQTPFSWKSLGVDVRGRSATLRINYRTSQQIRSQADRLLPGEISDVDGIAESRKGTISAFSGPAPAIQVVESEEDEIKLVSDWIKALAEDEIAPHEIAICVRSTKEVPRARRAVAAARMEDQVIDQTSEVQPGKVPVITMHLSKGLEFRAVGIMACDEEVIPSLERIENIGDEADLEDVHDTERHLLYVACTRARDHLLVTGVEPGSEFLDDLEIGN